MKRKNKIYLLLITIAFIVLGFIRDNIFVQINSYLGYLRTGNDQYLSIINLPFLKYFSFYPLYYFKFFLTLLFSLAYLLMTIAVIKLTYNNKYYTQITYLVYITVFIISFLIYASGYLVWDIYKSYAFSRHIMGIVQSPIICILLFFGFKLMEVNKTQNSQI